MKKYTICVCDDEPAICEQLKKYIVRYSFLHDMEMEVDEFDSADKLFSCYRVYDILFLDIRYGRNVNGIDVAEKLRINGNTSIIIIMTVLKSMLMDGYRAEPLRFIIKPFTEEQIHAILTTCIKKINRTVTYIKVINDSQPFLIRTDKIMYIYSKARKRQIVCSEDELISTWQSLNELMENLPAEKFAFSQKSYIVNLDKIDFVKSGTITLTDGKNIPLGSHFEDSLMIKLLENSKPER